jgi:hypothetical protein
MVVYAAARYNFIIVSHHPIHQLTLNITLLHSIGHAINHLIKLTMKLKIYIMIIQKEGCVGVMAGLIEVAGSLRPSLARTSMLR